MRWVVLAVGCVAGCGGGNAVNCGAGNTGTLHATFSNVSGANTDGSYDATCVYASFTSASEGSFDLSTIEAPAPRELDKAIEMSLHTTPQAGMTYPLSPASSFFTALDFVDYTTLDAGGGSRDWEVSTGSVTFINYAGPGHPADLHVTADMVHRTTDAVGTFTITFDCHIDNVNASP